MREGKKFKKLLIGVAAAAMTMLCTLPVSAATKSFKPITVKAGRCIHLLNTNIQSNAITNYSYRIQPQSSGTRYDIVYAYGGEAEALKGARTDSGQSINNTYIKSSTSSNQGMIACLKVTSGSVKLSVKITSPNAKSKLTAAYQSSSHSPLKNTRTIKKGQWIKMTRTGNHTLKLNWNSIKNATGYTVYACKDMKAEKPAFYKVKEVGAGTTSCEVSNLTRQRYVGFYVIPTVKVKGKTYKPAPTWTIYGYLN